MIDESGTNNTAAGSERVGFCQDCGRPLTAETVRPVGGGVFCEPCLTVRVGAAAPPPIAALPVGSPSPAIAAMLGFIPGVGAVYNGQYAKGLAHFVIFAVLSSLSDGHHSLFGLMCFAWYVYLIVDAYQTAKARREGLPLPNPFGLNDIGDRLGFGKNWPGSAARPVTQAAPTAAAGATTPPTPPPAAAATPDWVGYVPPTQFATSPPAVAPQPVPPVAEPVAAAPAASWGSIPYAVQNPSPYTAPYTRTYTGAESYVPVGAPPAVSAHTGKRFPTGAIWLIGVGVVCILLNLDPNVEVWRWIVPLLLAGLATWMLVHRVDWFSGHPTPARVLTAVRLPVMLLVLAVLFTLQAARLYTFGQTWPVLLLVLGGLLLVERSLSYATPPYVAPEPPRYVAGDDATKGGA